MAKEERVFYADARGVRIGSTNAVFGQHRYATRNIEAAVFVSQHIVRWPAYMMFAVGIVAIVYGFFDPGLWFLVGVVAILSGLFSLSRRKGLYAVRIVTPKGPVLVLASQDKAYVRTIVDALHRALDHVKQPLAAAPEEAGPSTSSHG